MVQEQLPPGVHMDLTVWCREMVRSGSSRPAQRPMASVPTQDAIVVFFNQQASTGRPCEKKWSTIKRLCLPSPIPTSHPLCLFSFQQGSLRQRDRSRNAAVGKGIQNVEAGHAALGSGVGASPARATPAVSTPAAAGSQERRNSLIPYPRSLT